MAPPGFKGYRPYGNVGNIAEHVDLLYEEYEAIKLADYDIMNHDEAAVIMGISRPTFARVYESARRKIARALVETREIKTVFGNALLDKDWYHCISCYARFTIPDPPKGSNCPICKSNAVEPINK